MLNKLYNKSIALMFFRATGLALSLGASLLFSNFLTLGEFAAYAYVMTWLTVLLLPAMFGMDLTIIKFLPVYLNENQQELKRGIERFSIFVPLAVSAGLAFIMVLIVHVLQQCSKISESLYLAFTSGALLLPGLALLMMLAKSQQAHGKVLFSEFVIQILRVMALVIPAVLVTFDLIEGQASTVFKWVAFILALIVAVQFFTSPIIRDGIQQPLKSASYRAKDWLTHGFSFVWINGFQLLLARVDIIMLGLLASTIEAGLYSVAAQLSALILISNQATTVIVSPSISVMLGSDRKKELQVALYKLGRVNFISATLMTLLLIALGQFLLALYGKEFLQVYPSLVILALSTALIAYAGGVTNILSIAGHHNVVLKIVALALVLNLALNLFLIPLWGMLGAAIATSVSALLRTVLMVVLVRKKLGLSLFAWRADTLV